MKPFLIGDLFCGAGGSSNGILAACESRGLRPLLTAVNHWNVAVATHSQNHPEHRHFCADLDSTSPNALIPEGYLDLLWASPQCTEHSYAKGGRAVDDQKRVTAWCVVRWIEAMRPRAIIVENVPQFAKWAPLDSRRRPIKSREGETFDAWCNAIRALGYTLDFRILNAADYGDPQTRRRLFVVALQGRRRVYWPNPSHARNGEGGLERWVSARSILDLALPSESIFTRKKALSPNTIKRIEAGIQKFVRPPFADAFMVVLRNHATAQSLDDPAPTITAGGTHLALVEPELTPFVLGQQSNSASRDIDGQPLPTIACGGKISLVEPFILGQHGGSVARDVGDPLPTIACDGAIGIAEPFVVDVRHGDRPHQPKSFDDPLGTITSKNGAAIIEPFILPSQGLTVRSTEDPLPTLTAQGRSVRVIEPYLVAHFGEREGQVPRTHSVDEPLPTVTQRGAGDLVMATATKEGPGIPIRVGDELYRLDIHYRMLQLHELAAGQSFPDGYAFSGSKTDAVAQVGNAVPKRLAEALTNRVLEMILPVAAAA